MATRLSIRFLAVGTLCLGLHVAGQSISAAPPMPKVEEMARVQPRQLGVAITMPAAAELARCRVVPYPANSEKPSGYVLVDAANRPLRRFLAVGTPNYNIYSFYKDGQEVYRETDTRGTGKIDLYRWFGSNGSKAGFDTDGNGSIDVWDSISPEEVSKEVFEAIVQKDPARLQSLVVTAKDLQAIGLPPQQAEAILARTGKIGERFQKTVAALNASNKARWIHVELWTPETTPKDEFQGATDLVRHRNAGVLIDKVVENKAETFQLGELILVGRVWKLIDGPSPGTPSIDSENDLGATLPAEVQTILKTIAELPTPAVNTPQYVQYHFERGNLYAQAAEKLQKHPQQEPIVRQMIYAYSTAAEMGNEDATKKLKAWQGSIEQVAPKGALAGLVQYRMLTIERSNKIRAAGTNSKAIAEAQSDWRTALTTFIKTYPSIEETPDAMYQLALAEEGNGKSGESEAVKVYEALAKNFPQHPIAPTALGSIRRLMSEGQLLALTGTTLDAQPIDLVNLKGKVVVVYYWGSFHSQLKNDATELAAIQKKHGDKIAIVTVCLDQNAEVANQAVKDARLPGAHLFDATGNLATQYGVIGSQMFVIGKDGKVTNKNGQISQLADEVERLMK